MDLNGSLRMWNRMSETETVSGNIQHQADTDGINLLQGESVLQNRRPGWSLWWKQLGFAALVLLVGVGGGTDTLPGALLVGGAVAGVVVLARMQSRYIVTTERVKIKVGLISKTSREYRIPDIQSLTTSQSIFERLLGYGTITLRTASNDRVTWHGVPEYEDVANSIREEQREHDQ